MAALESDFAALCQDLTEILKSAYESSVTIEEAERLAAKFLHAQIMAAQELAGAELDARMRKTGVKAIKAAVYMKGATSGDKKPSDVLLQAQVDMDKIVQDEQESYDVAEVRADSIRNYLNIFKDGHIYFRGISRGRYE